MASRQLEMVSLVLRGPARSFVGEFLFCFGITVIAQDVMRAFTAATNDTSILEHGWFTYFLSLSIVAEPRVNEYLAARKQHHFLAAGADPAKLEAQLAQAEAQERASMLSGRVGALCGAAVGAAAGYYYVGGLLDLASGAVVGAVFGFAAGMVVRGLREGIGRA